MIDLDLETLKNRATPPSVRMYILLFFVPLLCMGCRTQTPVADAVGGEEPPEKLSDYGLFAGNGSTQEPMPGVVPYDVNTALFSDYALKYRFVRLPPGTNVEYRDA